MTYFTGLDLHKRSVTATTLDAEGAVVATAKMPCRPKALLAYFAQIPGDHAAAVECTTGWYWVKDALADHVDLTLAHAKGVKAVSSAKVKTDSADAKMLAHLLRTDLLPEAHMISDEGEVKSPHRAPCVTCSGPGSGSSSGESPRRTRSPGSWRSTTSATWPTSTPSASSRPRPTSSRPSCSTARSSGWRARSSRTSCPTPTGPGTAPGQRLLRVPGVGKAGAFTVRLEVDDISRFPTERAFFSYCRLVPGADNSGERTRHKRSRDGNRYLKMAFSHAAVRAIQYYPEVRAWYGAKKRKKPEAVARALVAKEIARIVYHVLRKQEDFNGQFKGKPLSRQKKELWPLLASPASRTGAGESPASRPPLAGMGSE